MISIRARSSRATLAGCAFTLVLAIAVSTGCSSEPPDFHPAQAPTLVIGIDGFEWDLILPLIRAGELPVIADLVRRGSYGLLDTLLPTESPAIWTSIATGMRPEKHGITGFNRRGGKGKKAKRTAAEPFSSRDRKTKAIWNIAGDYDRTVGIIGWSTTYPAESVKGVMVSRTNTREKVHRKAKTPWSGAISLGIEGQVYPLEREAEVFTDIKTVQSSLNRRLKKIFGTFATPPSEEILAVWATSRDALRADLIYQQFADQLHKGYSRRDLFMVYFAATDVLAHRLWRYHQPEKFSVEHRIEEIQNFGHMLNDYYRYMDRVIGVFVRRSAGHRIIIISDHGMQPARKNNRIGRNRESGIADHKDAPAGVLIAAGPSITNMAMTKSRLSHMKRSDLETLGSVLDITPTLLTLMGLPVAQDMDGQPIRSIIQPKFLKKFPVLSRPSHEGE